MQLPTRQAGPPKRTRKQRHQLSAGTPGLASEEDSQDPRARAKTTAGQAQQPVTPVVTSCSGTA